MTATIYARARAELERRGWRQGPSLTPGDPSYFEEGPDPDAPCCTLLALNDASTSSREWSDARFKILARIGPFGSVGAWNDAPGRTVEQVYAVLDQLDAEATP